MELGTSVLFQIHDRSCEFRSLNVKDVKKDYLEALREQKEYIENIPSELTIDKQREYVKSILDSDHATICGLFLDGRIVGTAGIPLSTLFLEYIEAPIEAVVTVGIFVFNRKFRGIGLGKTLVWAAVYLFHKYTQINLYGAGMAKSNIPSIKSFLSCGFRQIYEDDKSCKVLLNYSELTAPEFITHETISIVDLQTNNELHNNMNFNIQK